MEYEENSCMEQLDQLETLCRQHDCLLLKEQPLRKYTTFRIGGNCKTLIEIGSSTGLQALVAYCNQQKIRWTVMGNGSNILASDDGFGGVIFLMGRRFSEVRMLEGAQIFCQAGMQLGKLSRMALEESLSGMQGLAGIPGTVGGALYMNAGAYGSEMADVVLCAEYLDEDGMLKTASKEEMCLSYRHSMFSDTKRIITGVTLQLRKGSYDDIKTEMEGYLNQRRAKQPLELPSAGSTFKRPVGGYAAALIDQCGLKGLTVGGAQVSPKHAGFVVNVGNATCADVLRLTDQIRETVLQRTGITLELEIRRLG
jgi:UDP-N-acetylmuramate dehydrogenase